MSADEMFLKMGYEVNKKPSCQSYLLFYVKGAENEDDPYEYIIFHKNKTITTVCNDRTWIVVITTELLQAINKKVVELRLEQRGEIEMANEIYSLPKYKSKMSVENTVIMNTKHFNWLQKILWKILLGIEIEDVGRSDTKQ